MARPIVRVISFLEYQISAKVKLMLLGSDVVRAYHSKDLFLSNM